MAGTTEPNQFLRDPYSDWVLGSENFKSRLVIDNTAESWFEMNGAGLNVLELKKAPLGEEADIAKKRELAAEVPTEIPAPEPASTRIIIAMVGLLLCGWKLERRRHRKLCSQNEN
jgi:hypothetical protein